MFKILSVPHLLGVMGIMGSSLILSGFSYAKDSNVVKIDESVSQFELSNHVGIYLDATMDTTIQEILDPSFSGFERSDKIYPSFGNFPGRAWIKIRLQNTTDTTKEMIINFDATVLTSELYDFNKEGDPKHYKSGRSFDSREEHKFPSRMNAYKVTLVPGQQQTYYLAITSELVYSLKLMVLTIEEFYERERFPTYFSGFYVGIMMIMFFYNLFIYISTRDILYLYYIATVFFLHTLFVGSLIGNTEAFGINIQVLDEYQSMLARLLGTIFTMQFGRLFLKTGQFPKVDKFLLFGISGNIVLIPTMFFLNLPNVTMFANWLALPSCIALIAISGVLFSQGHRYARFYFLAWFPLLLGAGAFITINNSGNAHLFPHIYAFLLVGAIAEVLMLSLALADKINQLQKEKRASEEAHKAKIMQMNLSLEEKVLEQTRDIKSMMEHISMGIFTITQDMTIHKDYSTFLESLLNENRICNQDVMGLVFEKSNISHDQINQMEATLESSLEE